MTGYISAAGTPAQRPGVLGWARRHRFALLSATGLLLTIIVLWLPTGWRSPDMWDVWMFITQFDQGHSLLFYPTFPTRPLTSLPFLLAYLIDPTSFLGFNLVLAGLMLIRGALTIAIVHMLLRGQPTISFLCGILSLVYPADTAWFFITALNIHLSATLVVVAIYLLLLYWYKYSRWALAGSLLALVVTLAGYEAGLPLVFATPLLLWWTDRRLSRRLLSVSAIWLTIASLAFAVMAFGVVTGQASYQSSIRAGGNAIINLINGSVYAYIQVFQRGFQDGANVVMQIAHRELPALFAVLAVCSGLMIIFLTVLIREELPIRRLQQRQTGELTCIALLAIPLGYLIYTQTALNGANVRTFYFTGWAASVAMVCALWMVSRLPTRPRLQMIGIVFIGVLLISLLSSQNLIQTVVLALLCMIIVLLFVLQWPWSFYLSAGLIFTISMLYQLRHHADFYNDGRAQTAQLIQIVEQAPGMRQGSYIVLLNHAGPLHPGSSPTDNNPANFISSELFDNALNVIYRGDNLEGRLCNQYTFPVEQPDCEFAAAGIMVSDPPSVWHPSPVRRTIPYSEIVVFSINAEGAVTLLQRIPAEYAAGLDTSAYQPDALIDRNAPPPPRALTMLPP